MSPKTVLVVDDAATIRAAMRIALEHSGFRVMEAEDGRAAVDTAQRLLPDVVLLDLVMPRLDGWQTARALRRDFRSGGIPLIAISALEGIDAAELETAGFCAHLRKPFTLRQLLDEISRCLVGDDSPCSCGRPLPPRRISPRAA